MKDNQPFSYICDEFTLRWDEEHEILFVKDMGKHDEAIARKHQEIVWSFFDSAPKGSKIDFVIDSRDLENMTREARKIYAKIPQHPKVGCGALYGMSALIRAIANVVAFLAGRDKDVRIFANREKAIQWVLEQKQRRERT